MQSSSPCAAFAWQYSDGAKFWRGKWPNWGDPKSPKMANSIPKMVRTDFCHKIALESMNLVLKAAFQTHFCHKIANLIPKMAFRTNFSKDSLKIANSDPKIQFRAQSNHELVGPNSGPKIEFRARKRKNPLQTANSVPKIRFRGRMRTKVALESVDWVRTLTKNRKHQPISGPKLEFRARNHKIHQI